MSTEKDTPQRGGWTALVVLLVLAAADVFVFIQGVSAAQPYIILPAIVVFIVLGVMFRGLFTVEPNQAAVLLLFGRYKGTEKVSGFRWANPLYTRRKISLRARNFDSDKLKVNEKTGNPIEISAVVLWRVRDTAQAVFDVDDFSQYVHVQSESAVRHIATTYPYDQAEEGEVSLRLSIDEVSQALGQEIQERVREAGVQVIEARINHLAYAPEIASAMLQRQQAEAVIAARQKIVDGAVGMVQMAISRLEKAGLVDLDEERKATMVSNLMVVLCSHEATQPVINAGSLY